MNKIVLITTKGCRGCEIMSKNIKEAIENLDISLDIKDIDELDRKFKNTFYLKDCPTMLFFKNKSLEFKYVGTMPTTVITRWIDMYYK